MGKRDRAELERAVSDGEWLLIGDLMVLFDATRSMVDRWLNDGVRLAGSQRMVIRYRVRAGGAREAHPGDVLAVLAETRKVRSADDPDGTTGLTAD
ncbi:hypothetical protein [Phytohabitans houttuyneae]|uniref:Uncharacterized protein n=1 Tax=Phytohabitans houttuyneae TaxID=1076126 RepID=A0A6V8KAF4_9ACTN|nr:hypothetical protein [Phytohabitans houttuyneae]GFJ79441.1 hypothetical protein Phou_036210 [Phytohabitans houttuyneae]